MPNQDRGSYIIALVCSVVGAIAAVGTGLSVVWVDTLTSGQRVVVAAGMLTALVFCVVLMRKALAGLRRLRSSDVAGSEAANGETGGLPARKPDIRRWKKALQGVCVAWLALIVWGVVGNDTAVFAGAAVMLVASLGGLYLLERQRGTTP
ncbi:MAG: hypothetical protein ACRDTZ_12680 [Pseudonocardiaceae bacterium]